MTCVPPRRVEEEDDGQFAQELLTGLADQFGVLMVDQFANYLCQKLLDVCSVNEIRKVVNCVLPSLVEVSMDGHGTRVI